ncbi:MAG: nucleotidyltransferase family protein, partial [Candidatus Subteraquimicrobiales bacterium]|nr:nucleotidyltransferase family protein [Candidatus Subteraquimicrobiales bacterium]
SLTNKACLSINGKPMIEYVIVALRGCSSIRRIVVVGPELFFKQKWAAKVDKILIDTGNLTENIFEAISYLETTEPVLVVTSDIPLITPEAISDFLKRCFEMEGDIYYPIISRACIESKFPKAQRTYFKLKEGTFTGGNLGLAHPIVFKENKELIEKIYSLRKSPFRLVRLLGGKFVLKFLSRSLTIAEVEKNASRIIGACGRAVVTPYPEVGIDVDKKSDLELVRQVLD